MKNLIISCSSGDQPLLPKYATQAERIRQELTAQKIDCDIVKIVTGENVQIDAYDSFIITGSHSSVYNPLPWIRALEDHVLAIIDSGKPLLGICFGHQLIAKAMGGLVEKNKMGWEIGGYQLSITSSGSRHPLFHRVSDQSIVYQSHQDIVATLPKEAVELAYTNKGNQAFSIGSHVMGLQFHPEFRFDFMQDLKFKMLDENLADHFDRDDIDIPSQLDGVFLKNFSKIVKASK